MGKEIERKFKVVSNLGSTDLKIEKVSKIRQTYIYNGFGEEIRLREDIDLLNLFSPVYTLTVKKDWGKETVREEFEVEISKDAFDSLSKGKIFLCKMRTSFIYEDRVYFLDIYEDNSLLKDPEARGIVEAEFELEEDSINFKKPSWLSCEITGETEYKNYTLWRRTVERRGSF